MIRHSDYGIQVTVDFFKARPLIGSDEEFMSRVFNIFVDITWWIGGLPFSRDSVNDWKITRLHPLRRKWLTHSAISHSPASKTKQPLYCSTLQQPPTTLPPKHNLLNKCYKKSYTNNASHRLKNYILVDFGSPVICSCYSLHITFS